MYEIATRLTRSENAVTMRARFLGLSGGTHGIRTLGTAARESGYDRGRLMAAVEALKLRLKPIPRTDPRQRKRGAQKGLDETEWEQVFVFLGAIPDGRPVIRPGSKLTPRDAWGTGGKPASCLYCSRTARPHYARGRCDRCYWSERKRVYAIQASSTQGTEGCTFSLLTCAATAMLRRPCAVPSRLSKSRSPRRPRSSLCQEALASCAPQPAGTSRPCRKPGPSRRPKVTLCSPAASSCCRLSRSTRRTSSSTRR